MNRQFIFDALERSGWTGAQAALAVLGTDLADVSVWWAAPVALVLAAAKAAVAKQLGRKGTASTLPAAADPASTASGIG